MRKYKIQEDKSPLIAWQNITLLVKFIHIKEQFQVLFSQHSLLPYISMGVEGGTLGSDVTLTCRGLCHCLMLEYAI